MGADPHPDPASVRLLTSHAGLKAFVAQPPFADDPFLRETWEKHQPILDAEARLTRLTTYLSLTRLDAAVTTDAAPTGVRTDRAFESARRKINGIKPYVLALATADSARAIERVRPALKRLELVVCDHLSLRYTWDGEEATPPDATCFIATRQEQHGRRPRNYATAYLELDPKTQEPDWFAFGRQLAQHLTTPTLADAITMLLKMGTADRARLMADRNIDDYVVAEAREQLQLPTEDEEENLSVIDTLLPSVQPPAVPIAAQTEGPAEAPAVPAATPIDIGGQNPQPSAPPATPPPEIDLPGVRIIDGTTAPVSPKPPKTRDGSGGGYGGSSTAPTGQEIENQRVGKRGEWVVVQNLRQIAESEGRDPGTVVWVSEMNETASYDVAAIEDSQRIYIEVKSTKSADPDTPFVISEGELIEASIHQGAYYLYRVTSVDTATPTITRIANPLQHIKDGKGELVLRQAMMQLNFEDESP